MKMKYTVTAYDLNNVSRVYGEGNTKEEAEQNCEKAAKIYTKENPGVALFTTSPSIVRSLLADLNERRKNS